MILAVDVGNSSVKLGLIGESSVVKSLTLKKVDKESLLVFIDGVPIQASGIASVVPAQTAHLNEILSAMSASPPLIVSPALSLPFEMGYETPETLGTDRLAAAVGGRALFPDHRSIVVIDIGTAVTFDVISDDVFLGGIIAPGPDLMRKALAQQTAQLPEVDLEFPSSIIGRTTTECLQSGIMGGFIASINGLLDTVSAELPDDPAIVLTGGWAASLKDRLKKSVVIEPHLVLYGIRDLVRING